MIKKISELHSFKGWLFNFLLLGLAVVFLPLLNIWLPEDSVWHVPNYMFSLLGKYLCYALVALAVDLIWGYTGILSLGHGVFFSIGGYAMGMYLMRSIGKKASIKVIYPILWCSLIGKNYHGTGTGLITLFLLYWLS